MVKIIYRNIIVSRMDFRVEFERIELMVREGGGTIHPLRKYLRIPDFCKVDLQFEHEIVRG